MYDERARGRKRALRHTRRACVCSLRCRRVRHRNPLVTSAGRIGYWLSLSDKLQATEYTNDGEEHGRVLGNARVLFSECSSIKSTSAAFRDLRVFRGYFF